MLRMHSRGCSKFQTDISSGLEENVIQSQLYMIKWTPKRQGKLPFFQNLWTSKDNSGFEKAGITQGLRVALRGIHCKCYSYL